MKVEWIKFYTRHANSGLQLRFGGGILNLPLRMVTLLEDGEYPAGMIVALGLGVWDMRQTSLKRPAEPMLPIPRN